MVVSGAAMTTDGDGLLARLVVAARTMTPAALPTVVAEEAAAAGFADLRLYGVDYEQATLWPLERDGDKDEGLDVDGTVAGHAYTGQTQIDVEHDHGRQVWTPIVNGSARVGVMSVLVEEATEEACERLTVLADLLAELILTRDAYGDTLLRRRRTRELTLAAEMQWTQLPPLAFSCKAMSVSAVLEPSYEIGGDTFDYAVETDIAHLALFDAMGHGLVSCRMAALVAAAYRHARRRGLDLADTYAEMDSAIVNLSGPDVFLTGVLMELDLSGGTMRLLSAGHPMPLLLRGRNVIDGLDAEPSLPIGLGEPEPLITTIDLEPGDKVVAYSDGIVEARSPEGAMYGIDRLVDVISREAASGLVPAEQLRRLTRDLLDHQQGKLRDDATVVMCQWRPEVR